MSDIERRLASIEVMLEELASRPVPPHAEHHEMVGMDTVRLSVQNGGTQLNRQRTVNFGAGLTATESSANKRIDVAVALTSYTANANADLALTTDYQDVPNATLTLAAAGTYLILGAFQFDATAGATVSSCIGQLVVDGTGQAGVAELGYFSNTERIRATVAEHWIVTTASAGLVAKLQAKKAANFGTMSCLDVDTRITAVRIA